MENKPIFQQQQVHTPVPYKSVIDFTILKEFHRIVFSQKSSELDACIEIVSTLQVNELENYIVGLKKDLFAIKNGIDHKYNN